MAAIDELLKKYWGYTSFRSHQREVITSVLEGRDTVAVMATGGGKSLCYQVPALYLGGLTLVVSPLISLMKDQVDDLDLRGIPAAAYTGSLTYKEREEIERRLAANALRLLFLSPEKCTQPAVLRSLRRYPVRLIAIDEAHCISEWGHNFWPEYRQLSRLKTHFPDVPIVALTATAVPEVREDIARQLGLSSPREFVGSFNRANLRYSVVPKEKPMSLLLSIINRHRNESGIVYCFSKRETEEIAHELRKYRYNARAYHAGLSAGVREKVQDAFLSDRVQTVCATIAFGMGIDKPDVRYVVHYDLPKTIESYYQETGRAGRDGLESECVLFYDPEEYGRVRSLIEHDGRDKRRIGIAVRKLDEIVGYCETTGCRRKYLLHYFGEEYAPENCGMCDTCDRSHETTDGTAYAQKIIGCVGEVSGNAGADLIADVLRGSKNAKVRENNFDLLPSYGTGREQSRKQYRRWINDLVRQGYLGRTGDGSRAICLTETSAAVMRGEVRVMLPAPEGGAKKRQVEDALSPEDRELFVALKTLRTSIADRDGVPPSVVFPDRSLIEMARLHPSDRESLGEIPGVGAVRLEKYGPDVISAIMHFQDREV
ncbi:DNA helicase RecQ [uncultured Methanofollis sp.]|uniref:DNA helicase RecQ n=1 Tax=uncultured Methanofollis sp. TaxID=262500 RepID=UPI00260FE7FA|nr:DNA helicase RecQ [uncultured Methanofollis sp.]